MKHCLSSALLLALLGATFVPAATFGYGEAPVPLPSIFTEKPQTKCARMSLSVAAPPSPGLRAQAVSPRLIRVQWWFANLPVACRPKLVLLGIVALVIGKPTASLRRATQTPTRVAASTQVPITV